eukprot:5049905-Pleurochrysis_carterae.AAC.1
MCAASVGPPAPFRKWAFRRGIREAVHRHRGWRIPVARDSRPPRSVPSPFAVKRRRNANVACACRRNWRSPRACVGMWGDWWRRMFDRTLLRVPGHIPARTSAP